MAQKRRAGTPHPVAAPPRQQPLLQIACLDVVQVYAMQQERVRLKTEIKKIEEELDPLELSIIERLEAGLMLELGAPRCAVNNEPRRNPKWKEQFIALAGKRKAQQIINATPQTDNKSLIINVDGTEQIPCPADGKFSTVISMHGSHCICHGTQKVNIDIALAYLRA